MLGMPQNVFQNEYTTLVTSNTITLSNYNAQNVSILINDAMNDTEVGKMTFLSLPTPGKAMIKCSFGNSIYNPHVQSDDHL